MGLIQIVDLLRGFSVSMGLSNYRGDRRAFLRLSGVDAAKNANYSKKKHLKPSRGLFFFAQNFMGCLSHLHRHTQCTLTRLSHMETGYRFVRLLPYAAGVDSTALG